MLLDYILVGCEQEQKKEQKTGRHHGLSGNTA